MNKEICGYTSTVKTRVMLNTKKRNTPYYFEYNGKVIARFDTEEKARMYQSAFQEGVDVGYYLGKDEIKKEEK